MDMFSRKDLVHLFAPLLVEQLLAVLVGMADVVMVAAVGETAVSGVALVADSMVPSTIQLVGNSMILYGFSSSAASCP